MIQLWFTSRALGLVALLVLAAVLVLGILHNTTLVKRTDGALPRFVLVALHRNLSLVAVVLVVLHVVTTVVTGYVQLRWLDVLVPGTARYNTLPAALGALGLDLLIALVVTSVLRQRLSRRVWFVVHWSAYLFFPVTVAHAVLNASFRGTTWWTLVVPVLSVGAVVAALGYRLRDQRRVGMPLAARGQIAAERAAPVPARAAVPAADPGDAPTVPVPVPAGVGAPAQPLRIVRGREAGPTGRHALR